MTTPEQVHRQRSFGSIVSWILAALAGLLWVLVLFAAIGAIGSAGAERAGVIVGRLAFPWIAAALIRFGWVKLVKKGAGRVFISPWTVVIAAIVYLLMVIGAAS